MTDLQVLTLAIAIVSPVVALIYSNSRISDTRDTLGSRLNDTKETLRAEMGHMKAELLAALQRIENKIDHVQEILADQSTRLDRLERK